MVSPSSGSLQAQTEIGSQSQVPKVEKTSGKGMNHPFSGITQELNGKETKFIGVLNVLRRIRRFLLPCLSWKATSSNSTRDPTRLRKWQATRSLWGSSHPAPRATSCVQQRGSSKLWGCAAMRGQPQELVMGIAPGYGTCA